jgi:hypothetical protein
MITIGALSISNSMINEDRIDNLLDESVKRRETVL